MLNAHDGSNPISGEAIKKFGITIKIPKKDRNV
jgi:hypothetical protein